MPTKRKRPKRPAVESPYLSYGPQPGPQTAFLATPADIAFYGGAAGGGKTFALLLEACRHLNNPRYAAAFFRRTVPQITHPGGAWEKSTEIYPGLGGWANYGVHKWLFASGATIGFHSIQHEKNIDDWGSSQLPVILVDEATLFTAKMFWGLVVRNRTDVGIDPYMRLSCNPDPDSWVAEFIAWWIDQQTGFPIPERSGRIRWFVRVNDTVVWADDPETLTREHGEDSEPMSVTFVAAKLSDNPILLAKDPRYLAKLKKLPYHDRVRLLGGNWLIKLGSGLVKREWFRGLIVPSAPPGCAWVRYWDTAGTDEAEETADLAAWTCGELVGKDAHGRFYVADEERFKLSGLARKQRMRATADMDRMKYGPVTQWQEVQGGGTGKEDAADFVRLMAGHEAHTEHVTGNKVTRFLPFASQCEARNVCLVAGPWIPDWMREIEAFPKAKFKDRADATGGGFSKVVDAAVQTFGTGIVPAGDSKSEVEQMPPEVWG